MIWVILRVFGGPDVARSLPTAGLGSELLALAAGPCSGPAGGEAGVSAAGRSTGQTSAAAGSLSPQTAGTKVKDWVSQE